MHCRCRRFQVKFDACCGQYIDGLARGSLSGSFAAKIYLLSKMRKTVYKYKFFWTSLHKELCSAQDQDIFVQKDTVTRFVTVDGVWIGNWIYWTLENRNYN
jgi:hypothetical protein